MSCSLRPRCSRPRPAMQFMVSRPACAAGCSGCIGNNMPLTHEFLSEMIGVRRTSVTGVAGDMQRAGMISHTRGRLHIVDIELVRMNACECHDDVQSQYERIMGRKMVT